MNCVSLNGFCLKATEYYCGLKMWSELLIKEEKELESFLCFKKVVYSKLLEKEHELEYFWIEYFWGLMISVPSFFSLNVSLLFNIVHVLHLFCCSFFTVNQCSKYREKKGKNRAKIKCKKTSCDQARAPSTCKKPVQNHNEHATKLLGGWKKCCLFYVAISS